MGRFDLKYDDDQRAAIARAMNERGLSAGEAVRAASEGLDGLPPFKMPESTARDVARDARERSAQVPPGLEAHIRSIQDRGFALIDRELTRVEEGEQVGNADATKLTKLARLAIALRDLSAAPRRHQPQQPSSGDEHTAVLAQLEEAFAARQRNGEQDPGDDEPAA